MKIHEKYIKRCIEIGKNGLGSTRPNPMVGCVIVHNNTIIGEGFTSPYGGNHAEVNAINSVKNKTLLKNATLYVTLEPCSHYGKTPPCSDLIINYQIPDVVIGCMDDNEKVAGKGIKRLMEAGCRVTVGIMESECRIHHKRFFTFHNKKRPYLILKWAETKNGFMAPKIKFEQKPIWITNRLSRQLVHKWRAEEQAILIGANTIFQDNPTLTVRNWSGQHPIRIVLDKNNALSNTYHVFNDHSETLVIREISAKSICEKLYNHNINSVIIEGGTKTLQLFIDANLWDEARVFTGKISFENGVLAPRFYGNLISEVRIDTDILKIYRND
ncbi:bifunctional diaminohydroxyphosphoribosylaminopyrimidine deaminase/5-amino-6-(5-phosphoribosylamino)uracil reductase RibD [Aestuariivivens sediminis]|uniref:bifunctional diaminohydroxyphosphoribosylaminopyrimidine deaminase/5-amino-6-(5-phosphoribosylamino)uracil reductase RibD n=1 Tax=Aestuariivivens sediminis TaxID=2913557 RepID=UPI001F5A950F|nr:bifunctional diaminohydroxyphosphoribosylaminopyrimidine deaminase/5-amino-6-(5-phosphoribosylamino)uracil reductase RibD [Aestuariivivens sediminis]